MPMTRGFVNLVKVIIDKFTRIRLNPIKKRISSNMEEKILSVVQKGRNEYRTFRSNFLKNYEPQKKSDKNK